MCCVDRLNPHLNVAVSIASPIISKEQTSGGVDPNSVARRPLSPAGRRDRSMKTQETGAKGLILELDLGAPCWSRTSSGCCGRSMVGLAWPAQWVYTARRTRTNEGVHGMGQSLGGGVREYDAQTGQFKRPDGK